MEKLPKKDTDPSLEKEKTMEKSRLERLKILEESFFRIIQDSTNKLPPPLQKIAGALLDASPIGSYTMSRKAISGESTTGEKILPSDRLLNALTALSVVLTYSFAGHATVKQDFDSLKMAGVFYTAHWALLALQHLPKILAEFDELADKNGLHNTAGLFRALKDLLEKNKDNSKHNE